MLKDLVNKHKGLDSDSSTPDLSTQMESVSSDKLDSSNHSRSSVKNSPMPVKNSQVAEVAANPDGNALVRPNSVSTTTPVATKSQARSFDDTEEDTGTNHLISSTSLTDVVETGREEFDRKRLKSSALDLGGAFEKELSESKLKIQVKAVKIPISLDEFVKNFIVDDASSGWQR
jgi:hypothetical protein